jgi:ferrochelatase
LLVNFGGPRSLAEIEPFLIALLTDRDVIRTKMPYFLQKRFFARVAKKRAKKIEADYRKIGGKSPIFEDTERIAQKLRESLGVNVLTFHRYLPETHSSFLEAMQDGCELTVFPLFPQFSYATTGSIARFFQERVEVEHVQKLHWIKSYATHPAYIRVMQNCIRDFLHENRLKEEECALLFSAHGLPQEFVNTGDRYQIECDCSFREIAKGFPRAIAHLSYQSKFGRGEWLRPYTDEVTKNASAWCQGRKNVVIVPLSFTSDHIETLFEIEEQYLPPLREAGFAAYRCHALNLRADWLDAIAEILQEVPVCGNEMLVRAD